jgi:rfaE bifunctional protein nucleotidyltransferase chain/domain
VQVEQDRAEILAALECVNAICIFNEPTPIKLIETVKPDFLVKGGDWDVSKIVGADFVINNGGQVKALPFVPGRSTSDIIKKINS